MGEEDRPDEGSLEARLKGIEEDLGDAHKLIDSCKRKSALNKRLKTGAVLLIVVVVGIQMYRMIKAVTGFDVGRFTAVLNEELGRTTPEVIDTMSRVVKRVAPVYEAEFKKKAKSALPDIKMALCDEAHLFAENLEQEARQRLLVKIMAGMKEQEEVILEGIPALKDEKLVEQMLENFANSFGDELLRLFDEKLDEHFDMLVEIDETIGKFEPDPQLIQRDDLWQLLLATFMEFADIKPSPEGGR